jgi:predicted transcriptional regulator
MSTVTLRLPDDTCQRLKQLAAPADRDQALAILDRLDASDRSKAS